jgi:hypothetical protein
MNISIEIQGLDQFKSRIGNHQNIITSELKRAEKQGLTVIRDEAKSGAAAFSNVLPQSIRIEVAAGGLEGIVGSVAKTALSIHEGRSPGHAPSYAAIERWLQHKGSGAAQLIRGRRYVKARGAAARDQHDEAVVIVNAIRQSGTKPLPFVLPAAAASKDRVMREFDAAVTRALKRFVGKS